MAQACHPRNWEGGAADHKFQGSLGYVIQVLGQLELPSKTLMGRGEEEGEIKGLEERLVGRMLACHSGSLRLVSWYHHKLGRVTYNPRMLEAQTFAIIPGYTAS